MFSYLCLLIIIHFIERTDYGQAGLGCIATCAFLVIGVGIFSAVYSVVVGFGAYHHHPPSRHHHHYCHSSPSLLSLIFTTVVKHYHYCHSSPSPSTLSTDPSACSPPPPMYADGTMSFVRFQFRTNKTETF